MAAIDGVLTQTWGWYGAAMLGSAAFPAVLVQATVLANWYVDHPVVVPGDGSPGGGNMGYVAAVPIFAVAAIICLVFPLLWGITVFRARRGVAVRGLAVLPTVLQCAASLVVFPVAAALPYGWADVTALAAGDLLALVVTLKALWSRRVVT